MSTLSDVLANLKELPESASMFVSGCAAEIPGLADALSAMSVKKSLTVGGIFLPGLNRCDFMATSEHIRCQSFFMTPELAACDSTRVDYHPWRYREIVRYLREHPFDVAVVMLSPPDSEGFCSYGVTSDFAPLVLPEARIRIGIINKYMPRIPGVRVNRSELDHCVELDIPLLTSHAAKVDETSLAIARHVAAFVADGATIQLGLGSIPGAVTGELVAKRHLRVHSGLIERSILTLEEAGALDRDVPVLGGVALGESAFFELLHNNPRFSFQPISVTHDQDRIADTDAFVAVNGALQVDLLGQTNSFVLPNGFISGPGGLPEFVGGALASKNGRSIIALNATAARGEHSRIVPQLIGGLPSLPASDADVVITEFGTAELRGKSVAERIDAMIAIADPRHRESLLKAARATYN